MLVKTSTGQPLWIYFADYSIQAEFTSSSFESAVLVSPLIDSRPTTAPFGDDKLCLIFSYMITSTIVSLDVGVVYGTSWQTVDDMTVVATLSGASSESTSGQQTWLTGQVMLSQSGGQLPTRALFVASKTVDTVERQTVAIDNVTITTNCTGIILKNVLIILVIIIILDIRGFPIHASHWNCIRQSVTSQC